MDLKDLDVFSTFRIKIKSQNLEHECIKDQWPYPNKDQDANPHPGTSSILQSPKSWLTGHGCSLLLQNQEPPESPEATNENFKDMDVLCSFKIKIEIQIKSWLYQRPVTLSKSRSRCKGQSPPASSKAPNEDIKDMDVLCTFKIKIESQNSNHGCIKDQGTNPNEGCDAKPLSKRPEVSEVDPQKWPIGRNIRDWKTDWQTYKKYRIFWK